MITRTAAAAFAGAFALGATIVGVGVNAGGEKVAFPENWAKGTLYQTIDRYDVKQYRELYSTPEAVTAVKQGRPIPSGTVLTLIQYKAVVDAAGAPVKDANGRFQKGDLIAYAVMEKRTGWGTEYKDDMRNGEWEYQAFKADKTVNDKANLGGCFTCHKPHAGQDFVISLAGFTGTASGAKVMAAKGPRAVAIGDFLFGPEKIEVKAGEQVTWTNTDASPHQVTITSDGALKGTRTPIMLKGQSQSLTLSAPGVYDYICGLHPQMKGKFEVK